MTMEIKDSKDIVRFSLILSKEAHQTMQQMANEHGLSQNELLRQALELLHIAYQNKHNKLVIANKDDKLIRQIILK